MSIPYSAGKQINFGSSSGGGGGSGTTFFPSVSDDGVISWMNDGGYQNPDPVNIKGKDGEDGFSPTIDETNIGTGYLVTITDKDGTDEIELLHGASPTITEQKTDSGYEVTVHDANGEHSFELKDGEKGETPDMIMEVNVDDTTGNPDVTVDKGGTAENPVFNLQFTGLKGEKGETGFAPTIKAEETDTGYDVTITNETGDETFSLRDGIDGAAGSTPSISANAIISGGTGTPFVNVTKDGTDESPIFTFDFNNIKGEKGDKGEKGSDGDDGKDGTNGKDGVTPDITMEVSVDGTAKTTPTATVTRRGDKATPIYNIAFSGLKGNQGDKGEKGDKGDKGDKGEKGDKGDKGDKGEDGTVGTTPDITASASVDAGVGTPAVSVTKSGTIHNPNFDFAFKNMKGERGNDGITPNIGMSASVTASTGTPSVKVTRSGTDASPNFNLAFSGLKGETGGKGDDGFTPTIATTPITDGYDITITNKTGSNTITIKNGEDGTVGTTPDISATASVGNTTGTPSVNVTKSGTILNPNFDFAFTNMKGADGISPTLTERKTTNGYDITIRDATGSSTISLNDGDTPNIGASATADNNIGIPAVSVTKSGTLSNPSFAFDFRNIKGERGEVGAKGEKGNRGEKGDRGVDGATGTTLTPEIGTVTTVGAYEDASASVTVDNTTQKAIFDFSIPRGQNGNNGYIGGEVIEYTMLAANWKEGIYPFEDLFPFDDYDLEVEPNGDRIAKAQLEVWNRGQMAGSYSSNNCIAFGDTPDVNIPVIIKLTNKGGIRKLDDVSNVSVALNKNAATFTWNDPQDKPDVAWAGTLLVRKEGSEPLSYSDGTAIVDLKVRNQYESVGYEDSGLSYNTEYYYRFFPYSTDNAYTNGTCKQIYIVVSVDIPTVSGNLVYDGSEQTQAFTGYDDTKMTASGITGTNAGNYMATFSLLAGYQWSDGTTEDKTVEWSISKAAGAIELSKDSVTLDLFTLRDTVEVLSSTGTVSVASDSDDLEAAISDGVITLSVANENTGSVNVNVSTEGTDNYEAATKTIKVEMIFSPVALNDATWEYISKASANGIASSLWNVGDTKAVKVSGTVGTLDVDDTYYAYILGFDHNPTYEPSGITFGCFKTASGVDIALCDDHYNENDITGKTWFNMNHQGYSVGYGYYGHNYGGWKGCDLRYDILGSTDVPPSQYSKENVYITVGREGYDATSTCATSPVENTLMAALPSDLRAVMKPMTKYTDNVGDKSTARANVTASIDYLPILSSFELTGTAVGINTYEKEKQRQYQYFINGNSKAKYKHNSLSTVAYYWLRSATSNASYAFIFVNPSGASGILYQGTARSSMGLFPIFLV